jgi:hypothetical protein
MQRLLGAAGEALERLNALPQAIDSVLDGDPDRKLSDALVAAAAEAVEVFGEDALEAHAGLVRQGQIHTEAITDEEANHRMAAADHVVVVRGKL